EGVGGTSTRALRAAQGRVLPCSSSDTSTMKKATLKNSWAFSRPAISGNTARITGTAPRRPIQEMKVRSRRLKPLNGSRPRNTEIGRAKRIIHSESSRAGTRSEEHTSELQSRENLVCRLLLEKKKRKQKHEDS